ncbi:hypothetical protein JK202_07890 [Gluconobacter sp. Dm-62]|uniref:hypothetical protein n=1 Tax=Gluconobacter sp. Dm-62 TaxID=2799804 RepID=UPI001B8B33A6|nr:hypothetical protein [Gluconobacter sp. Dm-62]MBS1102938.1 hypothetical protein [Gluconobacter sp. Dm-62]
MDWTSLFQTILPYLPARYAGDIISIITFLIAAAALALRFWKPPSSNSKFLPLFRIVSTIAQAKGWNTSAYQPDAKAIMVPIGSSRADEAAKLGLDKVSTHPKANEAPRRAE